MHLLYRSLYRSSTKDSAAKVCAEFIHEPNKTISAWSFCMHLNTQTVNTDCSRLQHQRVCCQFYGSGVHIIKPACVWVCLCVLGYHKACEIFVAVAERYVQRAKKLLTVIFSLTPQLRNFSNTITTPLFFENQTSPSQFQNH